MENVNIPNEILYPLHGGAAFGPSGLILDELITQLSYNHPLFKFNGMHYLIDDSIHGTVYASTINIYVRINHGRSAYTSMI